MKILSIETSSDVCGVSILEDDKLICNLDISTVKTHSENLMPLIEKAFAEANLKLKDIDLIVTDIGPGSFTGIRIGVATVKAFVDSLNIACIGVSSLEALAYNSTNSKIVASIIDCKNDNCYFALYENKGNCFEELIEPQAENIAVALNIIKSYMEDNFENTQITFVGDGSEIFEEQIKNSFKNFKIASGNSNSLNSYNLGLCGFKKYENGIYYKDGIYMGKEILPLYLKKPQAQRMLEEKNKK